CSVGRRNRDIRPGGGIGRRRNLGVTNARQEQGNQQRGNRQYSAQPSGHGSVPCRPWPRFPDFDWLAYSHHAFSGASQPFIRACESILYEKLISTVTCTICPCAMAIGVLSMASVNMYGARPAGWLYVVTRVRFVARETVRLPESLSCVGKIESGSRSTVK